MKVIIIETQKKKHHSNSTKKKEIKIENNNSQLIFHNIQLQNENNQLKQQNNNLLMQNQFLFNKVLQMQNNQQFIPFPNQFLVPYNPNCFNNIPVNNLNNSNFNNNLINNINRTYSIVFNVNGVKRYPIICSGDTKLNDVLSSLLKKINNSFCLDLNNVIFIYGTKNITNFFVNNLDVSSLNLHSDNPEIIVMNKKQVF